MESRASQIASWFFDRRLVDQKAFVQFDKWLFEPETPHNMEEARRYAEELVSASALKTALADPWIDERIAADVNAINDSRAERMPVILSPEIDTIVGRPESAESLLQLLERDLGLQPAN